MRRSQMRIVIVSAAAGFALSIAACGGGDKKPAEAPAPVAPAQAEPALFVRLGGREAITAVVDDFVANCAADPRINAFFVNTDIPRLKKLLVEQICVATGGPCTYTGRDMV